MPNCQRALSYKLLCRAKQRSRAINHINVSENRTNLFNLFIYLIISK